METIFYRKGSRIIRRIYRSASELSDMLAAYRAGTSKGDYTGLELEEMLAKKVARSEALQTLLAEQGVRTNLLAPQRRSKAGAYIDRLLDNLPFLGALNAIDPTVLNERTADDFEDRIVAAYQQWQRDLRAEWEAQREQDRITAGREEDIREADKALQRDAAAEAKAAEEAAAEAAAEAAEQAARETQALQWAERLDAVKDAVPAKRWNEVAGYVETYARGTGQKTRSQIESYVKSREKAAAKARAA